MIRSQIPLIVTSTITVVLLFFTLSLEAQEKYWQQQADTRIEVKLNDELKTLDGYLQLKYTNNSPDTLRYIWFHLWPNAYKNDRTAFSEQLLRNGTTSFYFTDDKNKGYINKLDFRQGKSVLKTEDHPVYIDIMKVYLDEPLLPGAVTELNTPFHVKLPKRISRSGYTNDDIAVTQWYPKPAVYDKDGWHPMPYLDQGEFYAEYGNYDVSITVPEGFIVAATGNFEEVIKDNIEVVNTYRYKQDMVPDFAWFVSRDYEVRKDSVQLPSGKQVKVFTYSFPESANTWKDAIGYTKDAIRFRSSAIGEYPYDVVSVVQGLDNFEGGMEYPTITLISGNMSGRMLDFIIEHEIGHNWFQSALGSNEREHPWMDEGMNTYFDYQYFLQKYKSLDLLGGDMTEGMRLNKKLPSNFFDFSLQAMETLGHGQAVSTPSYEFTKLNNSLVPYHKAAKWLEQLEALVGSKTMKELFRAYFRQWNSKHPQPADFRRLLSEYFTGNIDSVYSLINEKGPLQPMASSRKIRPTFAFNFNRSDSIHYINFFPLLGYNKYDRLMPGLIVHNYNIPNSKFNFLLAPLYSTGAAQLNGYMRISYREGDHTTDKRWLIGTDLMRFSKRAAMDTFDNQRFENFSRLSPFIRLTLPVPPRSTIRQIIEFRTFIINEKDFSSFISKSDSSDIIYVRNSSSASRYINQLSYHHQDNRVLYPYDILIQMQQGNGFYRANVTGNYFFNYKDRGGLSVRLFASKFGYLNQAFKSDPSAYRYMPKLLGVRGEEDYTYSNYFVGRTATHAASYESIDNNGLAAQQVMIRDGGLKMRLDYFDFLQGRSDNWVAALNFATTLPSKLFPVRLPVKLFFDFGTSAEYWKSSYEGSRFLYAGGVQLSIINGLINVYAPLIYSKEIKDNLKSVPEINKFGKKLTFSIDIHRINIRKASANQIPL